MKPLKQRIAKAKADAIRVRFEGDCYEAGLPVPVPEYVFAPPRKWRFDYAWPSAKVALEVDGGVFVAGRHTRGAGWLKDTEKLNTAASMGWRLFRCTPQMLGGKQLLGWLTEALKG